VPVAPHSPKKTTKSLVPAGVIVLAVHVSDDAFNDGVPITANGLPEPGAAPATPMMNAEQPLPAACVTAGAVSPPTAHL
jgi:hypothetical protein